MVSLGNLADFGELVYLYECSPPDPWQDGLGEEMLALFDEKSFDPDLDFFAASGIMNLSHIALGTLVDEFGQIKVLLWDKTVHKYKELEVCQSSQ